MTDTLKSPSQLKPAAGTLTDLYAVPAQLQTLVGCLFVCNQSATEDTFRLAIAVNAAADDVKQYLYYDVKVPGNDTFATAPFNLAAGDVVRVRSTNGTSSFILSKLERA